MRKHVKSITSKLSWFTFPVSKYLKLNLSIKYLHKCKVDLMVTRKP